MTNQTSFEEIQQLCRDFRRQLRSGSHKRIEDYLNRVYEDSREMLFQNLLHIEIEFQRRQGNEPSSDEYLKRFPQHGKLIRQAFFESTLMSADPAVETPGRERTVLEDVPAGRKLGDYELLRQIGRGAFGAVYKAKHLQRGDVVALKLLPLSVDGNSDGSGDADRLHKFRREFRALCDVNHPNLVGMQSLEVDGRQWFFTMDLIEGTDFLDFVRPGGRLDIIRLRSALQQLAEGIAALHQRRIVHRDLKPANVMVNHDGHVIVLDFGLVVEEGPKVDFTVLVTKHGFAGTPQYAAPEQSFGDCDAASDWYAMGVMLYEALTGRAPFSGSAAELMRAKSSSDAPPLQEQSGVPADLAELTNALLQRDPDRRPDGDTILARLGGTVDTNSEDSTESLSQSADRTARLTLIGRDNELRSLLKLHRQVQESGEPLAVFVRGRSGEGKTSLADEFLASLRTDYNSLIFSGRCYDRESVPFKAVDAIIESLVLFLRAQQEDDVRQWLPDDISQLAQLFPMLRRVGPIGELSQRSHETQDNRQLRHRAFAALRDLLIAISARLPVVLFIDDLQWGDGDSATALRDVLQPPDAPRVLLLGTYRSDEAEDSPFLQEWADDKAMPEEQLSQQTLEVGPLSEEQCLNLLAMRLGTDADAVRQQAEELFKGTRGNPYFLDQLLESVDPETGSVEAVPLLELIERRLGRLPDSARPLLKAIAVAGQSVALMEAAEVAGLKSAAMSTVTHMRNERLVRLIGSTDEFIVDTYHDKVRETVLADMPVEERRRLHLTFAEKLINDAGLTAEVLGDWLESDEQVTELADTRTDDVFDIAHHLACAKDSRAFGYHLLAGAVSVAAYSMDTALEHLLIAQSLLPREPTRSEQFRLAFFLGKATATCERREEAIEHYNRALQVASSRVDRVECLFAQCTLYWERSNYSAAHECIRRGLDELGESDPSTVLGRLAATAWSFVQYHFLPARFSRRLSRMSQKELSVLCRFFTLSRSTIAQFEITKFSYLTIRSCVIARHSTDIATHAETASAYASTFALAGVPWLPARLIRYAIRLEEQLPAHRLSGMIDFDRGVHSYCRGHLDRSVKMFRRSAERLSRWGHYNENFAHHFLWHIYTYRGHTSAMLQSTLEESKIAVRNGDELILAYARYGMAEAMAKRGNFDAGLRLAHAAVNYLIPLRTFSLAVSLVQLSRVQIQAGDYASARQSAWDAIREIFRLNLLDISSQAFALHAEAMLTESWLSDTEKPSRRTLWKARLSAWTARGLGWLFPNCRPSAQRISGRVAAAAGRLTKARRFFGKAIQEAERMGALYELGRALIDRSVLGGADAESDRRRGLEIFDEIQCVLPLAERTYFGLPNEPACGVDLEADLHAIRHVLPDAETDQPNRIPPVPA